ncbi:uncharacterized protein STEHIDRAFT_92870 [Stereum hirsutum FP-91666 SS1]|uniref:uncharacterized protein n=1 Tax=Stereum hirsutum (strain FP-91666) TaxID=721885 RepID=UPI000440F631|nr:uncharacterized protein STEHIDRAFT_92870 [Stereum hirsutum FP-91666 SS1]EIM90121.1 hypothetical protein STEHIDRAFT_92870 [Stereum hirsutum FP-91666 SS1]
MASVWVPVLYVLILFGSLFTFGTYYRKRTATKQLEPYFPRHLERDIYVTLLNTSDPPTPDSLLKAALMRRAVTDITRILRVREDKPALQNLLQKGSIGDDLWNSLLAAEKELEAEIIEVVAEANSFVPGWGQIIFQTAGEMIANEKTKSVWDRLPEMRMENERKYGPSKRHIQVQMGPAPSPPVGPKPPIAAGPAPPPASSPVTPVTPSNIKRPNGLVPGAIPSSISKPESVAASSDGEGSVASKSTPKSGKKKKGKK